MILTAHQPLYMPWLGFFHKAILADVICILDDVQFADGDYINRNKIKTAHGSKWLTVPIKKKNHLDRRISEIEIINGEWQNRHVSLLKQSYSKTPYFLTYIEVLEYLIAGVDYQHLLDLDMAILDFLFGELGIKAKVILSSTLKDKGKKSDLILSICQQLGASVYISGKNGMDYLKAENFVREEIQIAVQNYKAVPYPQVHGDFIPNLSVIDLLFNAGPKSRDIIMSSNAQAWNELVMA